MTAEVFTTFMQVRDLLLMFKLKKHFSLFLTKKTPVKSFHPV